MSLKKISILVRMPNWLGDCVMALPAVRHLAECLPGADVYLAVREQFRPLLAGQPGVKGFLVAPGSGLGAVVRGISAGRVAARELLGAAGGGGGGKFDAGVLLTNSFSTALWLWGVGVGRRVGYGLNGRSLFLTDSVPCGGVEKSWHFVRYYLWLAEVVEGLLRDREGVGHRQLPSLSEYMAPRLVVGGDARDRARRLLGVNGIVGGYAVLAPASAYGDVKDWPASHYRELVRWCTRELSLPVVVTGGGGQRGVCEAIVSGQESAVSLAGGTDMAEFAGVLAESALFVGGDSGGAHVAAALGVPTVVIFGVTNPVRTRAVGGRVVMVGAGEERDVKLSDPAVREAARKALEGILPERVIGAVKGVYRR